jgi:regulator of cell morphogenesis and NO signaling
MENLAQKKVGRIVADNYKASRILTEHGIDFCCGGGITLEEACKNQQKDIMVVLKELEEALKTKDNENWSQMELDKLIDHIVDVHHSYVVASVPTLEIYLEKLCKVHGERHPELFEIHDLFHEGARNLADHMEKEEKVLFPYVKDLVLSQRGGFPLSRPHFVHINNTIQSLEAEHENEGDRFKKIASLTNDYLCPPDGCQTFRVAYALLKDFEADLHKHVHLENNILFPAAKNRFEQLELPN